MIDSSPASAQYFGFGSAAAHATLDLYGALATLKKYERYLGLLNLAHEACFLWITTSLGISCSALVSLKGNGSGNTGATWYQRMLKGHDLNYTSLKL